MGPALSVHGETGEVKVRKSAFPETAFTLNLLFVNSSDAATDEWAVLKNFRKYQAGISGLAHALRGANLSGLYAARNRRQLLASCRSTSYALPPQTPIGATARRRPAFWWMSCCGLPPR